MIFIWLRIPVYTLDYFDRINRRIHEAPDQFCMIMEELGTDNWFMQAIYYASPSLYLEFRKSLKQLNTPSERKKISLSIYKYVSRMSSRPTPFGLFAGVALGRINDGETHVQISATEQHKAIVRLDMSYLTQLSRNILQTKEVRYQGKYF